MCGSLTAHGWVWATVSILAAGAAGTAFYWADWIHGPAQLNGQVANPRQVTFEYGLFRRCNFLEANSSDPTSMVLRTDCGRYENFDEIPSVWWRTGTVLQGIGAGLLVLVALTAFFALFLEDVCNNALAYVAGGTQLIAGKLFELCLVWIVSTCCALICRERGPSFVALSSSSGVDLAGWLSF